MNTLWAPWRMEYILSSKSDECIFCTKPKEDNDQKNLIVTRKDTCFVIMNYYPYNNGHLMIVPYRHISTFQELNQNEQVEIMTLLSESTVILKKMLKAEGFNIGVNLGKPAGAGIDDHLHVHIVPRWTGDTNFMPVCGHTKVVPDALENTWQLLKNAFESTR